MATLSWSSQQIIYNGKNYHVSVASHSDVELLENALFSSWFTSNEDGILFLWTPPLIVGEVIGYTPLGKPMYDTTIKDKELWCIENMGLSDSIGLVLDYLKAPDLEYRKSAVSDSKSIVSALLGVFDEHEFAIETVTPAMINFRLRNERASVKGKQYRVVDEINETFFVGPYVKAQDSSLPNHFSIGALC